MKRALAGFVCSLVLAVPVLSMANGHLLPPVRESVEVGEHFAIGDPPTQVNGATILIRDFEAEIVTATLTTSALEPHHAYSIWWVVFNYPKNCAVPWECGSGDLANPAVGGSVFWGGGLLADGDGYGNTQIEMRRGITNRELFGPMRDLGLQNIWRGEVHLVLRTHGMAGVAGGVGEQIGTANEACPPDGCQNVFFSIHRRP